MTESNVSAERLQEMLDGLEGVTPGPFFAHPTNAAHFAACDPDTIRSLISEIQSRRSQDAAAEDMRNEAILRFLGARQRWVCDIDGGPNGGEVLELPIGDAQFVFSALSHPLTARGATDAEVLVATDAAIAALRGSSADIAVGELDRAIRAAITAILQPISERNRP